MKSSARWRDWQMAAAFCVTAHLRGFVGRAISPAAWGLRHRRVCGTMQASSRRRAWRKAGVYALPPAPGRNAPKPSAAKQSGPQRKRRRLSFEGRFLCCRPVCGQAALSWYIWQSPALLMDRIRPKALSPVCRGVPLSRPVCCVCGRAASRSAGKARSAPRLRPARPAAPRRWRAAGPGQP